MTVVLFDWDTRDAKTNLNGIKKPEVVSQIFESSKSSKILTSDVGNGANTNAKVMANLSTLFHSTKSKFNHHFKYFR